MQPASSPPRPDPGPRALEPPRVLGPVTAAFLVVGSMVGTGVFTTTGFLLRDIGSSPAVLLAWGIGGLAAAAGALAYAELVAALPRNGGEYDLLSRIYHPAVGFCAGVVSLVVGFSAPLAASALAFGAYCERVLPGAPPTGVALGLVAVLSLVHAARVSAGGRFQVVVTGLQVVLLVAFIGVGMHAADLGRIGASSVPLGHAVLSPPFATGLVYVAFAYSGWNAAAYVAGEVRAPARNLPRSLIGGTAVVAALYVGLNAVFLASAPPGELVGVLEVGHVSASTLFGPSAGMLVSLLVMLGLLTTASALVVTGPRVTERMGEDYPALARLAVRRVGGGPYVAILLQAALAAVMIVTASFDALLLYMGVTLSVSSGLTVLGVLVLRRREPELPRPYRAPLAAVLVALGIMAWMVLFAVIENPATAGFGVATLVLGLGAFFLVRRSGSNTT
jgi:basic amino acid/polyamine antiporter, APA family